MKRPRKPRFPFRARGRNRGPWYDPDWYECVWCQRKYKWSGRPCLRRGLRHGNSTNRAAFDEVRMENAARRKSKTMPRALRRAAKIAAAAATVAATEAGNGEAQGPNHLCKDGSDAPRNDGGTPVEEEINSDSPITQPNSNPTQSKHNNETFEVKKLQQQRQSKACTGHKDAIYEGFSLALDEDEDVARILAANRKAWPRGQALIAVNATPEDKEIAELIRAGLLAREELAVNHWDDDTASEDFCPYTVRIVDAGRNKGRKGNSRSREGPGYAVEQAPVEEADSDWWHLDDEVFAQLLSDGAFDLKDGSGFSFVYVGWEDCFFPPSPQV